MLLAIAGIAAATAATATTTAAAVFLCPEYCKARTLISYLRKPHLY